MGNTLLTPQTIARQALASLSETLVMRPLIYTDLSTEFSARKVGDTINVRKPAVFTANKFDRATGIELQNATEGSIPVKMDQIPDVSFAVTSEELTLDIEDFDTQFLTPAMEAIAQDVDVTLLGLRDEITQTAGGADPAGFEWDKPEVLIEAGRVLDTNKVPTSDRAAIIGPTAKARWTNSEMLKRADQSGSTDALRRASVGRQLFGFDTYWTQNVGQPSASPATGDPTTEVGMAFHKSALAFASAPLAVAPGSFAAVETHQGLSLRVAYQYDINKKQTVVSVDMLYGVKCLDPSRAVLLKGADAA